MSTNATNQDGEAPQPVGRVVASYKSHDDAARALPGVKRKDIDIEVQESELQISGEVKERECKGIIRRRSRRVGRFEYRVTLPTAIDQDSIEATLDEGVLTIRVPKPEGARRHRIEIGAPSR